MENTGTNRLDLGDDDKKECVAHGAQTTDADFMSHFIKVWQNILGKQIIFRRFPAAKGFRKL